MIIGLCNLYWCIIHFPMRWMILSISRKNLQRSQTLSTWNLVELHPTSDLNHMTMKSTRRRSHPLPLGEVEGEVVCLSWGPQLLFLPTYPQVKLFSPLPVECKSCLLNLPTLRSVHPQGVLYGGSICWVWHESLYLQDHGPIPPYQPPPGNQFVPSTRMPPPLPSVPPNLHHPQQPDPRWPSDQVTAVKHHSIWSSHC